MLTAVLQDWQPTTTHPAAAGHKRPFTTFAADNAAEVALGRTSALAEQPPRPDASTVAGFASLVAWHLGRAVNWFTGQVDRAIDQAEGSQGAEWRQYAPPGAWDRVELAPAPPQAPARVSYQLDYASFSPDPPEVEEITVENTKKNKSQTRAVGDFIRQQLRATGRPVSDLQSRARQMSHGAHRIRPSVAASTVTFDDANMRRHFPTATTNPPSRPPNSSSSLSSSAATTEDDTTEHAKARVWLRSMQQRSPALHSYMEMLARESGKEAKTQGKQKAERARLFSKSPVDITKEDFNVSSINELTDDFSHITQYLKEDEKVVLLEKQRAEEKANEEARAWAATPVVGEVSDELKIRINTRLGLQNQNAFVDPDGQITRYDLGRVLPPGDTYGTEGWLNDQAVNRYLEIVIDKQHKRDGYEKKQGKTPKVYAFNSQFMHTLGQRGYQGVERWAKRAEIEGTKLLNVEQILMPISTGVHWTLVAVSGTRKTITYYDSFGGQSQQHTLRALDWVKGELGTDFREREWTLIRGHSNLQRNANDCGVFVTMNGHALLTGREPNVAFPSEDAKAARTFMAAVLVGADLV